MEGRGRGWRATAIAACLLLLSLAVPAAGGEGGGGGTGGGGTHVALPVHAKHQKKRLHRGGTLRPRQACAPGDDRCAALRETTCDPFHTLVTDKCLFVRINRHCGEGVHRVDYLPKYYCASHAARAGVLLALLLWAGLLFLAMSKVAEDFLVPSIQFLATWLRLPPDVAGVTLFAFASGAPDLFTQVAAIAEGEHVDLELAVSATLGGGLFILCVVFAAVVLVAAARGDCPEVPDRRAFVRDALAYLLSTLAMLHLLWRGRFGVWEGLYLISGYAVYLAVCLSGSSSSSRGPGAAAAGTPTLPVALSAAAAGGAGGGGGAAARASLDAGSQAQQQQQTGVAVLALGRQAAVELVPRSASMGALHRKPSAAATGGGGRGSRATSPTKAASLAAAVGPGGDLESLLDSQGLAAAGGRGLYPAHPPGSPLPSRSKLPRAAGGGGSGGGSAAAAAWPAWLLGSSLSKTLHLHDKAGWRLWVATAVAPLLMLLHATMPALHTGAFSMRYAAILAAGAPLFAMAVLGSSSLTPAAALFGWLVSAMALYALTYGVHPEAGSSSNGGSSSSNTGGGGGLGSANGQALPGSSSSPASPANGGSSGGSAAGSHALEGGFAEGVAASLSAASPAAWKAGLAARRPRRNMLFALMSFAQCILWMSVLADEVVALFETLGRIADLPQDLLGATVLAWGETVPDLVATMSLARGGQATMAISAVYGGPTFNLLVSMGAPLLFTTARHGPVGYALSTGVVLLGSCTLLVLAAVLVGVPYLFGWRLPRKLGLGVLGLYAATQVLFLAVEL